MRQDSNDEDAFPSPTVNTAPPLPTPTTIQQPRRNSAPSGPGAATTNSRPSSSSGLRSGSLGSSFDSGDRAHMVSASPSTFYGRYNKGGRFTLEIFFIHVKRSSLFGTVVVKFVDTDPRSVRVGNGSILAVSAAFSNEKKLT